MKFLPIVIIVVLAAAFITIRTNIFGGFETQHNMTASNYTSEYFAAHDELDARLAEWTRARSRVDVTATLQMFRVPVAPMFTGSDQAADPHYQARGYLRWIDQPDLGWICLEGPCIRASGMAEVRIFPAPLLGQHTREICRGLLGLADAEVEKLVAAGTLEVPRQEPA